jgi:hypothetical protein
MLLKHDRAHVLMDLGVTAVTEQLIGIAHGTKAHSAVLTVTSTTLLTCSADKKHST